MGLLVGLLGGAIAAVLKAVQGRSTSAPAATPAPWTPIPDAPPVVVPPKPAATPAPAPARPAPPPAPRPTVSIADLQEAPAKKAPAKKAAAPKPKPKSPSPSAGRPKLEPWVEPVDGECPPTHPVKAKMSSKIYHLPGGFNYARTRPDRCYVDAAAAEADGLRPAKR